MDCRSTQTRGVNIKMPDGQIFNIYLKPASIWGFGENGFSRMLDLPYDYTLYENLAATLAHNSTACCDRMQLIAKHKIFNLQLN